MPYRLLIADPTVKAHYGGLRWIFAGLGTAVVGDISAVIPWLQAASLVAGTAASIYGLWIMRQHRKAELARQSTPPVPGP